MSAAISPPAPAAVDLVSTPQIATWYDPELRAVWTQMRAMPRPSFNPQLLDDLLTGCRRLAGSGGMVRYAGASAPFTHVINTSATPGFFSLGGDLALFAELIVRQDRTALQRYGHACVDAVHLIHSGYHVDATAIALVTGAALGGGFESALANEIVVAERQATFGLPEIRFNLFPGMGAYSFLFRKAGRRVADDLITSGRTCTAQEMYDVGVVDLLVETGTGEAAVADLVRRRQRRQNGLAAISRVRRRVDGVDHAELVDVVETWVDAALALGPRDLDLMHRLVARQTAIPRPRTPDRLGLAVAR